MKKITIGIICSLGLCAAGCGTDNVTAKDVTFFNADGDKIGIANVSKAAKGVKIHIDVRGLATGPHGLHIHEYGSCEGPDFKSAGSHFNPDEKEHGLLNAKGAHAGDLPNIEADNDGRIAIDLEAQNVTLDKEKKNSLIRPDGTSFIIQEEADDGMTQPAGDGGARVACGLISEKVKQK
ncbi:superoxide dismutase family protein [Aureibacillus halotolerans]|uniref:Superoxide dismutase [Cu-Zn] n=1 Tax=Aureibacillus halotolerans TaxID=1508390 RepID=A0A4R6U1Y3_9BACI|nr:superoxide dismutase family protein [Aureibacillus halotolerans]TDQ40418.1 Cu-Zn family superoxide dismutase [Aureibacillus halotolerans]